MNEQKAFFYALVGGVVASVITLAVVLSLMAAYDAARPTTPPQPYSFLDQRRATCEFLSPIYAQFETVPASCPDRPRTSQTEIFQHHNEAP